MTTPELIRELNRIKDGFRDTANCAYMPTVVRDSSRHKAKVIAAALRLLVRPATRRGP